MLKPAGARCNLACEYCYYREKATLYPGSGLRMDEPTLERITAAYLQVHPGPEVVFGWQGGEPLLMGVDFFRRALELQARFCPPGFRVSNALQTNGTLVDDEWAEFFGKHGFLVGISLDGPPDLHDAYRRDTAGRPSHAAALRGLAALQRHGVEYNALVTVNRRNAGRLLEVYRYLTGLGVRYLQFIPIVERRAPANPRPSASSVRPEAYGEGLCAVFDYWAAHDVGQVFVQLFESALAVHVGQPPSVCSFAPTCGRCLAVEHNGDLYACDHFVYPEYRRGQVTAEGLVDLLEGPEQCRFGQDKQDTLPRACLRCPVLAWCGGDCPKHRLEGVEAGRPLSHLCSAYRRFFRHSAPALQAMAAELSLGHPAARTRVTPESSP
jgi:uncharacterized protein